MQLSLIPFDLLYQRVVTEVNNHAAIYLLPLGNILMMIVSKWMQCLWHDLPDSLFLRLNITPVIHLYTGARINIYGSLGALSVLLTQKEVFFTLIVLVNVV